MSSHRGPLRLWVQLAAMALFAWFFLLPVLMVATSSVASQWVGTVLPRGWTLRWLLSIDPSDLEALVTSLVLAGSVALLGTVLGIWAGLALAGRGGALDLLLMMPSAVPSVVVGLMALLAYNRSALSASPLIVLLVQLTLVLPYCYRTVAAAVGGGSAIYREAAASLGAAPPTVLLKVVLPLLRPAVFASFALAFALSMGELGATLMVYPPGFTTAPIAIIQEVNRGRYYQAAALSVLLLGAAFAALWLLALAGRGVQTARRPALDGLQGR